MKSPQVGVVATFFNVAEYAAEMVDSVLGQTYTDIRLVLVDNDSPDGVGAILDEYSARHVNVQVIHNSPNLGAAQSKQLGVEVLLDDHEIKYIAVLDGDDIVHEDYIKNLVEMLESTGADQASILAESLFKDARSALPRFNPNATSVFKSIADAYSIGHADEIYSLMDHPLWCKIYRAELFRDITWQSPASRIIDDIPLVVQLRAKVKNGFAVNTWRGMYYRRRKSSLVLKNYFNSDVNLQENLARSKQILDFKLNLDAMLNEKFGNPAQETDLALQKKFYEGYLNENIYSHFVYLSCLMPISKGIYTRGLDVQVRGFMRAEFSDADFAVSTGKQRLVQRLFQLGYVPFKSAILLLYKLGKINSLPSRDELLQLECGKYFD
ncbi:MAG: glycosyltransferase [Candidatus Ancillula sp.]|jgi:glycosyltransferase involved in cell wall biosynthesis|nr:glycosyltransferase [Candidatus Ancillula sp.]